jgi:FRG domain
MRTSREPFGGIGTAIAQLGYPETIWYRGHSAKHRLLPALYRFPNGIENEIQIIERYSQTATASAAETSGRGIAALVTLHHSYVPTRLLEWTGRLHVALFCALVRESDSPAVFVLDPVALNACSEIVGIVGFDSDFQACGQYQRWPNETSSWERPVAIVARSTRCEMADTEAMFSLHGANDLPLEEQCPDCVRKVVLTQEERSLAEQIVLFGTREL